MGEFDQNQPNLFLSLSLQKLIEEMDNFIILESRKSGNHWTRVNKLVDLFHEKNGESLENLVKLHGYNNGLKNFFASINRFSIYSTPNPQDFYIALLRMVVPNDQISHKPLIKSRNNQHKTPIKSIKIKHKSAPTLSSNVDSLNEIEIALIVSKIKHPSILPSKIESLESLKLSLTNIVKNSIKRNPKSFVTIIQLNKFFFEYYKTTIRKVILSLSSDVKLIEILKSIPNLEVQGKTGCWQISLVKK